MKKKINVFFIIVVLIIAIVPLVFANKKKAISLAENRPLAEFPMVFNENGDINKGIKSEFSSWLKDNIGFRDSMIKINTAVNYHLFDKVSINDHYLGKDKILNYATKDMIRDYQHKNLYTEADLNIIADSYSTIDTYLEKQGIQAYYVQCYDKHSIYPEWFMKGINQYGNLSKTNQVAKALEEKDINYISLYETLMDGKNQEEVFSKFGDASHWNDTGAYLGYRRLMEDIVKNNSNVNILEKDDYNIVNQDTGASLNNIVHVEDFNDIFSIKDKKAIEINNNGEKELGEFGTDPRNRHFVNSETGNDLKILVVCDSYIGNFLIEDIAESFNETWMVWGDYITKLPTMLEQFKPDIILFENAERVNRFPSMIDLANSLK